jgi:hypothetical protein
VEFALNNSVHASTGFTPFFLNHGRHPTVPSSLFGANSTLSGGEATDPKSDAATNAVSVTANSIEANFSPLEPIEKAPSLTKKSVNDFLDQRQAVLRYVRDAIALSVDKQKENADRNGRKNNETFKRNELVLLSTSNLPKHAI